MLAFDLLDAPARRVRVAVLRQRALRRPHFVLRVRRLLRRVRRLWVLERGVLQDFLRCARLELCPFLCGDALDDDALESIRSNEER